jgi:hypothetical protein
MPDAMELLHSNLHEVFSERDRERRWAAIERTYTDDVTFIDPEGEYAGLTVGAEPYDAEEFTSRGGRPVR